MFFSSALACSPLFPFCPLPCNSFSDTEKLFFRLQCHQTPEILNSFWVWQDEVSLTKNASEVIDDVMGRLLVVMDAITDSVKGRVHYSRATKYHEDLVAELDFAICELQMVKLARLDSVAISSAIFLASVNFPERAKAYE